MSDTIRVLRVLEYTGPRDKIEEHLAQRHVKGCFEDHNYPCITIREGFCGDFAEVIKPATPVVSTNDYASLTVQGLFPKLTGGDYWEVDDKVNIRRFKDFDEALNCARMAAVPF